MQKALIEIVSNIIVIITIADFIVGTFVSENIVSAIRKMIRKTDNVLEFVKSQKRVTYFSILCKLLSLFLLVFSTVFLDLSWAALMFHMLAISIFIANITLLVTEAIH
jgi:hypothetical protein